MTPIELEKGKTNPKNLLSHHSKTNEEQKSTKFKFIQLN